jgi:ferredoxin-type protein NapF
LGKKSGKSVIAERKSRRDFLKAAVGRAEKRIQALLGRVEADRPIRPPGARPEDEFLNLCNLCGECEQACPEGTIQLHRSEDDTAQGPPVLRPAEHPCTFCGECIRVCPTGALVEDGAARIGRAQLIEERCMAWKGGACFSCSEKCPEEAITCTRLGAPLVKKSKCNGCGECAHLCPVSPRAILIVPE